jgi:hypothetical protein
MIKRGEFILGFLTVFIVVSCGHGEVEHTFIVYRPVRPNDANFVQYETRYELERQKDYYRVIYRGEIDTTEFVLTTDSLQTSSLRQGSNDFVKLSWDGRVFVNDVDTVYKFQSGSGLVDSEANYYWSASLGVFLIQPTTWPNSKVLKTKSKKVNKRIKELIEAVCDEEFYFQGQLEKLLDES